MLANIEGIGIIETQKELIDLSRRILKGMKKAQGLDRLLSGKYPDIKDAWPLSAETYWYRQSAAGTVNMDFKITGSNLLLTNWTANQYLRVVFGPFPVDDTILPTNTNRNIENSFLVTPNKSTAFLAPKGETIARVVTTTAALFCVQVWRIPVDELAEALKEYEV